MKFEKTLFLCAFLFCVGGYFYAVQSHVDAWGPVLIHLAICAVLAVGWLVYFLWTQQLDSAGYLFASLFSPFAFGVVIEFLGMFVESDYVETSFLLIALFVSLYALYACFRAIGKVQA
jgi:hypothetical protein